jgi:hypothetical protein
VEQEELLIQELLEQQIKVITVVTLEQQVAHMEDPEVVAVAPAATVETVVLTLVVMAELAFLIVLQALQLVELEVVQECTIHLVVIGLVADFQ